MYSNQSQMVMDCVMYDLLSNYYKYLDPQRSVMYYQRHLACMQQLTSQQRDERLHFLSSYPYNEPQMAMVRVLHASPNAPAVDVYANGQPILQNISFQQLSDYLQIPAGQYRIDIFPAGNTTQRVVSKTVTVKPNMYYTVAAAGNLENIMLLPIVDNPRVPSNKAKVRFWHLSPDAPAVDIAVHGGEPLFRNVRFKQATDYLELEPTTANLEVRLAGTNNIALTIPNVTLRPGEPYTAVATGYAQGIPPLEAIFLQP